MKKPSYLLAVVLVSELLAHPLFSFYPKDFSQALTTIAFGSCNRQDSPQPLWPVILETKPDLWIWGGDNIYGDSPYADVLEKKYAIQLENPSYQEFRNSIPIIGIWDDHDYGENNSGKWFQSKDIAQELALDFLEEPKDTKRRTQEGIYASYTFGPTGKQVKIILLDNRYHAELPGREADLLGETQWLWLENELKTSQAQIQLVVSGIQILQEEHRFEKWANFPKSRKRLINFIQTNKIPGVVFISGDRHLHEIAVKNDEETNYPLIEITSSGLTHSYNRFSGEPNKYRVGEVFSEKGFGVIHIDWNRKVPVIQLQIRDEGNKIQSEISFSLDELTPS